MALIEEMDRSGNWLFRWRSFLPLLLFFGAVPVDYRVATFSAINFAYTVALSLWAEGEKEKSGDDVEERVVEPAREAEVVEEEAAVEEENQIMEKEDAELDVDLL